jgi:branched-chain amino acid transport system ATP-binding protein
MSDVILDVQSLSIAYDTTAALTEASLSVSRGTIMTIIGSNGAGKSTILRAIAGLVRPNTGSIRFNGGEIAGLEPDQIVALGIALVPEGRRLFASMTVRENLELGAYLRNDPDAIARDLDRVLGYFPQLRERLRSPASNLSGGQQQMLAVARALMAAPRLLMLDEPSVGLAPIVVDSIAEIIRAVNAAGMSILLVEQNAYLALRLAETAYVLENGRIVLSGPANELSRTDTVRAAYLGL